MRVLVWSSRATNESAMVCCPCSVWERSGSLCETGFSFRNANVTPRRVRHFSIVYEAAVVVRSRNGSSPTTCEPNVDTDDSKSKRAEKGRYRIAVSGGHHHNSARRREFISCCGCKFPEIRESKFNSVPSARTISPVMYRWKLLVPQSDELLYILTYCSVGGLPPTSKEPHKNWVSILANIKSQFN